MTFDAALPPGESAGAGIAGTGPGGGTTRSKSMVSGLVVALLAAMSLALPSGAAMAAAGGILSGYVRDSATGDPLGGATVSLSGTTSLQATTGADGSYTLTAPAGTYTLTATHSGRTGSFVFFDDDYNELTTFPLADGDDLPADIYIDPASSAGQITGVVNAGGNGVAGVNVKVYDDEAGGDAVVASATTDGDGNYTVPGLASGRYLVFFDTTGTPYGSVWYSGAATRALATPLFLEGSESLSSINADLGAAVALSPTPVPTISGTAAVGATLTATPGTWGPEPVTLAYQWNAGGAAIAGATGATYALTGAEAGKTITVTVTGSKSGFASVAKTSEPTAAVATGTLNPAPVPTISGAATVGSTLTANAGTWGPAPVTLAYQWNAGGAAIAGATGATYALTSAEAGKTITVTVTGTKTGYATLSKTSAATAAVGGATLTPGTPAITGTAKVGSTLTANPGTWGPAPVSLSYQWLRDGSPIQGATASTYSTTQADAGKAVSVRVTGTKAGYTSATATSAAVTVGALGDRLAAGQQLTGDGVLTSSNGQFVLSVTGGLQEKDNNGRAIWRGSNLTGRLVMQGDGNLVMYSTTGAVLFHTGTYGNAGASVVVQSDGNVVVYSATGKALWSNKGYSDRLATSSTSTAVTLRPGQQLTSADRRLRLVMQSDGNLVVYSTSRALWNSRTSGNAGASLVLQSDGNLVVYSTAGRALWNSGTSGSPAGARILVMQSDGNLVLYNSGKAAWYTNTRG